MINFNSSFDINTLYGTTTLKCAEEILEQTIDSVVSQAALYKMTSVYSNAGSVASVRGTLGGGDLTPRKHKLRGGDNFKGAWVVCTKSSTGARKYFVAAGSKELEDYTAVNPTYDTPNKQAAREKGCFWALRQINKAVPKITTMGGPEALCAQGFYKINQAADIINVDNNSAVLEASAKLGLPMKNVQGNISKILRTMIGKNTGILIYDKDDFQDLINYDTDGYFCKTLAGNLEVINDNILCDYLCLTIQEVKGIRNTGAFADEFKAANKGVKDAIPKEIESILCNFDLLRSFTYRRSDTSGVEMRSMVFKLK